MENLEIYLIRHGKTYCNEKQIYCGRSDVDLSENGIEELKNKKSRKLPECEFYFTSGLKRANSTIDIIKPKQNYEILQDFSEYDFGDFELKGYNELKELKEYNNWINDESLKIKCPSGESRSQFRERISRALRELICFMFKNNKKTALGIVHGGVIGMILEMEYDNTRKFYEWQPKNGEGYKIVINISDYNNYNIESVEKI